MSDINVFINTIQNLKEGEYIFSEYIDGVQHNALYQNLNNNDFPNNPNDPGLNGYCHISTSGCLAWIAAIHNWNLDHCDNSSVGYGMGGGVVVIGEGCAV